MRYKLSKQEIEDALSKPFQLWPPPRVGKKPGPTEKQKLLFIRDMPDNVRPHKHPKDVVLFIGGSQSGKSLAARLLAVKTCLETPNALVVYGAMVYKDLADIVISEIEKMFTIKTPWDHPLIYRKPNEHSKTLIFTNGSRMQFLPLAEVLRFRGRTVDLLIIEEATQLPDAKSFEEGVRRMSSIKVPILQIVLLTNNPEDHNWLYDKFGLKQFTPKYQASGGKPMVIGTKCSCQYCQDCLFPSEDRLKTGFIPSQVKFNKKNICPKCKSKRDFYMFRNKETYCPGDQEWWRVIKISSQDNPHLPSTYIQDAMGSMDADTAASYITGQFVELRKGKVYWAFTNENILDQNEPINFKQDLIWSFDFNTPIQCSNIWQEFGSTGEEVVYCLDEVILPGNRPNGPEYIVEQFNMQITAQAGDYETLENFKQKQTIFIYGDPNGWSKLKGTSDVSYYQVIFDQLRQRGFKNVKFKVRKTTGEVIVFPIKTKVNSANLMYRSENKKIRAYINPKCIYLIASLDGIRFKADGKTIDDTMDKRFATGTDFSVIWPLTHPADAAAYYLVRRFPVVRDNLINPFAIIPNEELLEASGEGVKTTILNEKEKEKSTGRGLLSQLEDMGAFERHTSVLTDFYW